MLRRYFGGVPWGEFVHSPKRLTIVFMLHLQSLRIKSCVAMSHIWNDICELNNLAHEYSGRMIVWHALMHIAIAASNVCSVVAEGCFLVSFY